MKKLLFTLWFILICSSAFAVKYDKTVSDVTIYDVEFN